MIVAGLKQFDNRLSDIVNIKIIKRPEYFQNEFNKIFPKEKDEENEFDL